MEFKKILWKYFFFFFFFFFLIFNWNKISWIFYPTSFVRGIKYLLFYQKKPSSQPTFSFSSTTSQLDRDRYPNNSSTPPNREELVLPQRKWTDKENSVEMPTIEIFVPLIIINNEKEVNSALDQGAVLHPSSVSPGEEGRTIILGHSTMHRWPKNIAVWAFTYLPDLKEGDEILVNFNHLQYKYQVERKFVVKKGEDLPPVPEKENHLFLITCWPPGRLSFQQRYVVEAKLVE